MVMRNIGVSILAVSIVLCVVAYSVSRRYRFKYNQHVNISSYPEDKEYVNSLKMRSRIGLFALIGSLVLIGVGTGLTAYSISRYDKLLVKMYLK